MLLKQQEIEAVNNDLQCENKLLKNQVNNKQNQVEQLTGSVNDLEQHGRRVCLEVRGIPVAQNENTDDIVCSVGKLINADLKKEDISVSHRLKATNPNSP